MRTRDFQDLVIDRFYFLTDDFPQTQISIKKIRLVKDMILNIDLDYVRVNYKVFNEIIETIDIIGKQSKYDPCIVDLRYVEESTIFNNRTYFNGFKIIVKFIHKDDSL